METPILPTDDAEIDILELLTDLHLEERRQRVNTLIDEGADLDSGPEIYSLDGRAYDMDGNRLF